MKSQELENTVDHLCKLIATYHSDKPTEVDPVRYFSPPPPLLSSFSLPPHTLPFPPYLFSKKTAGKRGKGKRGKGDIEGKKEGKEGEGKREREKRERERIPALLSLMMVEGGLDNGEENLFVHVARCFARIS
jgi:hypothetical protein